MNIDFKGRIALVRGAGKGIGLCIALKLSKLGAKVFAISRTESNLDSLKEEDSLIETRFLDIGNWDNTKKVIEDIGQVDLLVNNAGISKRQTVLEVTEEFIDEHFDVNFKAALNISQIVAEGIISRKGSGAIVNISSISSTLAFPGVPIYCTTKAAMDMLTKSMALEFGPFKIVAKGIISRKGSGAIVNTSCIFSALAFLGVPIYCTTKAAMDMLTKSMALEFRPLKNKTKLQIQLHSC